MPTRSAPRTASAFVLVLALGATLVAAAPEAEHLPPPQLAAPNEHVDLALLARIRDEGLHRSQVMATITHLTDTIGPRLTGSTALREANNWTRQQFTDWGLHSAHLENWKFGRGWTWTHSQVTLVQPRHVELLAYPTAWSPAIAGTARGSVERIEIRTAKDLDTYRGKLAGKIVIVDQPDLPRPGDRRTYGRRLTDEDLADLRQFPIPAERAERGPRLARFKLRRALRDFLISEKALATISGSSQPWGEMAVQGTGFWKKEDGDGIPGFVLANEPFHLVRRMLDAKQDVVLELQLASSYEDGDGMVANTVAEIPGSDLRSELVMAGAHLDSWHTGTGATDNAAGCAVVMEAVRILEAIGFKPRRTIRVALWTGEEEGLLGSEAYVTEHLGSRKVDPEQKDLPDFMRDETGELVKGADYGRLSAYFNVDNGSGKIRGVFAQENVAVAPIFAAWLAPLGDLGADTVSLRDTGSTDHVSFDRIGLPGFQFIQDPLDYSPHTHHTTNDVLDHVERDDLVQASVVLATFLAETSMRQDLLPRKPLPPTTPAKAEKPAKPATAGRPSSR